jgi:hypothetical protein
MVKKISPNANLEHIKNEIDRINDNSVNFKII